ncbi:NAD(P)/FAD-dependent oxidoreductase [Maribacter halichondriae]|uniref:NAD(P)/FAD-dependent oxidoreductase n=1 Tax=Maribacter halichondriae TaxID=2980554 RepID=UPI0023598449|nr:FAD-binding oxidoreductase [Maribacter sp. Hal144]
MIDYLIVGLGLAGVSFSETLQQNQKTFKVVSDESQNSSLVAGGLYNPVILKRFTLAWKAKEQLDLALPFYNGLEKKLSVQLNYKLPVLRRFVSVEEQNLWFEASDKTDLGEFLSTDIHQNTNPNIDAPFGYGEVLGTGKIDTKKLIQAYKEHLVGQNCLLPETFDFKALRCETNFLEYKSIKAKNIVFAEGFGIKNNPYFKYLPVHGNKGEYVFIKAQNLKEKDAIKASIFCIPEGDDMYRIGANYDRNGLSNKPTGKAKTELLAALDRFIKCDYEVMDHIAGIRPTVVDRRPLIGQHPKHKNLYLLNGFGSRGVLIAPYAAQQLYHLIENGMAVDQQLDISRFIKKYYED